MAIAQWNALKFRGFGANRHGVEDDTYTSLQV